MTARYMIYLPADAPGRLVPTGEKPTEAERLQRVLQTITEQEE